MFVSREHRTDGLPGSHAPDLVTSIDEQLFTLPDRLEVWPGRAVDHDWGEKAANP